MKPLVIDLYCGLGGWSRAFLDAGYDAVGFDIERHEYGEKKYPGQLVLQDALTLHGSQFRDAAVIVASPPCQEFSYMAMPWSRAKQIAGALRGKVPFPDEYTGSRNVTDLTALFDACFRIQREASEAAGRRIPLVVENVKGAQPWVGMAKAHFGSFYLWGDVESVGGRITVGKFGQGLQAVRRAKIGGAVGDDWFVHHNRDEFLKRAINGVKGNGGGWLGDSGRNDPRDVRGGVKQAGMSGREWFAGEQSMGRFSSRSDARKAASALIAEIPYDLALWIAESFKPTERQPGLRALVGR